MSKLALMAYVINMGWGAGVGAFGGNLYIAHNSMFEEGHQYSQDGVIGRLSFDVGRGQAVSVGMLGAREYHEKSSYFDNLYVVAMPQISLYKSLSGTNYGISCHPGKGFYSLDRGTKRSKSGYESSIKISLFLELLR